MFTDTIESTKIHRTPKVSVKEIGIGDIASKNTLEEMKYYINNGLTQLIVRQTVHNILRNISERSQYDEIKVIFKWVQDHCRYTNDPKGLECITAPEVMLEEISKTGLALEDCDSFTILLATLLKFAGYPVRLKAVGFYKGKQLSHVYLQVKLGDEWMSADAIKKDKSLGWESNNIKRVMYLEV